MKILFAHNSTNLVKKGDRIKKGDYIGEIGTANGKWLAHLHLSASEGLSVAEIKSYIVGWSKTKVQKYYRNPKDLFSGKDLFDVPIDEGNAGYDWLQWIGNGYHPGVDYNGLGGGNTDYGYKIKSPFDGEIIESADWKGGWGKCVVLQVNKNMSKYYVNSDLRNELKEIWEDFDHEKESDHKEMADKLEDYRDSTDKQIDKLVDQYRKLIKDQDNLNKAHDLELTRQKTSLTTDFNAKLKDLQDKLYVCNKLKDGAMDLADDSDCKETIIRLEDIIKKRDTEINKLDLQIAELKKDENLMQYTLKIISNFLKKWTK